jgi:outer membrane protein assembly factor BamB
MFHHDAKHTGKTTHPGTHIGALKWRFKTDGQIVSSPAIASDGTVYVGSDDNYFYAINRDGSLRWRYKTGNIVRSSPAIASDGTVYVGSFDGKLYAFNPDGTVKWSYQTGDGIESSPAVTRDGTIYVGSSDFYFYALNPDGSLKWRFFAGDAIGSSPAVGNDGNVYFGCWLEDVFVLDQNGFEVCRWLTPSGGVFASPTITANGTVWIANDSAWVDTLSQREDIPDILKKPWFVYRMYPDYCNASLFNYGEEDVYSTPAVEADTSIVIGYGQKLLALNPDGVPNWSFDTGGKVDSSPVIGTDGIIYVGSDDGIFYAIDPNCACPVWQYQTGGCVKSSAAIDNDEYRTIYVGSQDGCLYAFYDGYKISGKVTCNGAGLSGVTLTLTSDYLTEPAVTITDSQGEYDFSGLLSPLTYTVTPVRAGYYFTPSSAQVAIENASQEDVDFGASTTAAGYSISGTVNAGGTGLSGVTMTLTGGVPPVNLTTTTNATGYYSFSNLSNGIYTVTPGMQGYGFVPASQNVTVSNADVGDVNFAAALGSSITGRVTIRGYGLQGVTMTLSSGDEDEDTTVTDSEGYYVFAGLSDGSYTVAPSKQGFEFDQPSEDVTISGASEGGVNFTAEAIVVPRIFFITPIVGVPGQLMNIIGWNFGVTPGESGKVNFGAINHPIKYWSNWKILIYIPQGSDPVEISVTTDQGTSNAKKFFYVR